METNITSLKRLLYSNNMFNTITICTCLFGSVYLCSKSLELMNNSLLEDKKISNKLIILNGLTFIVSGSIFFGFMGIHYYRAIKQN